MTLNMPQNERDLVYYLERIQKAPSCQDLVFFRNKTFDAIVATLPPDDVKIIMLAWLDRAKEESLPVVPSGQKRIMPDDLLNED